MTRINLVPPAELMDQHLFAEFREIKMVPKALARSLKTKSVAEIIGRIPKQFTLNTGHVMFFFDKGLYLWNRYEELKKGLDQREINYNKYSLFDPDGIYLQYPQLFNDYKPTPEALYIIRERIADKIALKPNWYRYTLKEMIL
jgi:deoxyribonuclease (pyrimidine dimer)